MQSLPTFTFTQALLVGSGLLLVPAFGVATASVYTGQLLTRASRFALGAGAPFIAWVAGACTAAWAYPSYPYEGPPEWIAAALSFGPGVVAGVSLVALSAYRPRALEWVVVRTPPSAPVRRKPRLWPAVTLLVLAFAGTFALAFRLPSPYRLQLPSSATRITETCVGDLLLGDHSYVLEADLSESDFRRYVQQLELQREPFTSGHVSTSLRYASRGDHWKVEACYAGSRLHLRSTQE